MTSFMLLRPSRVASLLGALAIGLWVGGVGCASSKVSGPSGAGEKADGGAGQGGATGGTTSSTQDSAVTPSQGGATAVACGTKNNNPFNCKFAWGAPAEGYDPATLDFVSTWIGDEPNGGLSAWSPTATNSGAPSQDACGDCALVKSLADSKTMLVLYTYFIGFQACKQGKFCDCDRNPNSPNLCTHGAQWIRENRAVIVNAYGQYAKAVYANSPKKPVIWWLEGDFMQYSYAQQSAPLRFEELGALTRDITCAIKSNQPNAIVAMNHSPWVTDPVSVGFWASMPKDVLDLVWVQGAGDQDAFVNSGNYNATSANFAWLHKFTGLKIMAETSFGSPDRWSTTTVENVNARIASGVIGVHVNHRTGDYPKSTAGFTSLTGTCN